MDKYTGDVVRFFVGPQKEMIAVIITVIMIVIMIVTGTVLAWLIINKTVKQAKRAAGVHFLTYGDDNYRNQRERLRVQAEDTGWFETVTAYTSADVLPEKREQYAEILAQPRGGGYWVWKVLIIDEMLRRMKDGDILVYVDAGCEINNVSGAHRFKEYVDMIRYQFDVDLLSFELNADEQEYTTERIFQHFKVPKGSSLRQSKQLMATVRFIRCGPHARRWLDRVLGALEADPWLFSDRDNDNKSENHPSFIENRHDQSIQSVVAKMEGSLITKDETLPAYKTSGPFWATRHRSEE